MQGMPTSQGPGWWQASDQLWYPPETAPGAATAAAAAPTATAPPQVAGYAPQPVQGYAPAQQLAVTVPPGTQMSSLGKRFGAYLLDGLLVIVTLVIGWIIWDLIAWKNGQSPAKQILKMRCIDLNTGRSATWGKMFLREFIGKYIVAGACFILTIVSIVMIFGDTRQALWDKLAGTIVVDDPNDVALA